MNQPTALPKRLAQLKGVGPLNSSSPLVKRYQTMKSMYGKKLVDLWNQFHGNNGETHVDELLGIASWILERLSSDGMNCRQITSDNVGNIQPNSQETVLDLGCGSGILTYLLSENGINCRGIDKIEREIWKHLNPNILSCQDLIPDEFILTADLIIGSHPDQLTLWIPKISTKSNCKGFIIIPCCFYELDGTMFMESSVATDGHTASRWNAYLNRIKQVSQECGYNVEVDPALLTMPGAKNVGLIGSIPLP